MLELRVHADEDPSVHPVGRWSTALASVLCTMRARRSALETLLVVAGPAGGPTTTAGCEQPATVAVPQTVWLPRTAVETVVEETGAAVDGRVRAIHGRIEAVLYRGTTTPTADYLSTLHRLRVDLPLCWSNLCTLLHGNGLYLTALQVTLLPDVPPKTDRANGLPQLPSLEYLSVVAPPDAGLPVRTLIRQARGVLRRLSVTVCYDTPVSAPVGQAFDFLPAGDREEPFRQLTTVIVRLWGDGAQASPGAVGGGLRAWSADDLLRQPVAAGGERGRQAWLETARGLAGQLLRHEWFSSQGKKNAVPAIEHCFVCLRRWPLLADVNVLSEPVVVPPPGAVVRFLVPGGDRWFAESLLGNTYLVRWGNTNHSEESCRLQPAPNGEPPPRRRVQRMEHCVRAECCPECDGWVDAWSVLDRRTIACHQWPAVSDAGACDRSWGPQRPPPP